MTYSESFKELESFFFVNIVAFIHVHGDELSLDFLFRRFSSCNFGHDIVQKAECFIFR